MNSLRNSTDWQSFAINQIKPYPGHARSHNKQKIEKLKKLIRHFGQVVPIVVDRDGVIIDGHAAKSWLT
jgi:ParB-like chromosome segregation protein Spo0J